jgi:small-conductance mechanosensitive channel
VVGIDLIIAAILLYTIGPLVLGLLLGLISERIIGLLLLFLIYVLLVWFWQGGLGTPSGPPTLAKASWFFAFYLLPALVGYTIGYVLTKKRKLSTVRLLRRKEN